MKCSKCSPTQLFLGFLLLVLLTIGSGCSDSSSPSDNGNNNGSNNNGSGGEKEMGTVIGKVYLTFERPEDSISYAGTKVIAEGTPYSTTTNDKGEFALQLPTGTYRIIIQHEGFDDYVIPALSFSAPGKTSLFYPATIEALHLLPIPSIEINNFHLNLPSSSSADFGFQLRDPKSINVANMIKNDMKVILSVSDSDPTLKIPGRTYYYRTAIYSNKGEYESIIQDYELHYHFSAGTKLFVSAQLNYSFNENDSRYVDLDGIMKYSVRGKKSNLLSFILN